jgi:hypothetical protein
MALKKSSTSLEGEALTWSTWT